MSNFRNNLTISCQACVSAPAETGKYTFRDTDQVWLCRHRMDERLHPLAANSGMAYIAEVTECNRKLNEIGLRQAAEIDVAMNDVKQLRREKESLSAKLAALMREREAALVRERNLRRRIEEISSAAAVNKADTDECPPLRTLTAHVNSLHEENRSLNRRLAVLQEELGTDIVICERCCPNAGGVFLLHKGFKCPHVPNPAATNDSQATNKVQPSYYTMSPEVVLAYEPLLRETWTSKTPGAADMLAEVERERQTKREEVHEWQENGIRGVSFPSERRKVGDVLAEFDRHKAESQAKPQEPQQSGWISVEESLPEVGQRVLVTVAGQVFTNSLLRMVDGFPLFQTNAGSPGPYVTHWMPLPAPPK